MCCLCAFCSVFLFIDLFFVFCFFFFFKQKTAYEMRISDWSSDVCSSDLFGGFAKLLIYAASFVCIAIAPRYFGPAMRAEYSALIVFAALGMGIMAASSDLMTLYDGLELNSLASYVLASFMRGDDR